MTPMPDSATSHHTWLRRADRWVPPTRHRIAGADEDGSGASFRVRSPRDGRELAVVADAGEREVERAVRAARRAFDSGPWPRLSPAARGRVLLRLADRIEEHRTDLALAVSLENGKPVSEAHGIELPATVATFRWYGQLTDQLHDASPHTAPARSRSSRANPPASSARSSPGTSRSPSPPASSLKPSPPAARPYSSRPSRHRCPRCSTAGWRTRRGCRRACST